MPEEQEVEEVSDAASENDYEGLKGHEEGDTMAEQKSTSENGNGEGMGDSPATVVKPKLDPKDPLRPRRKKARRACFACQRAHLTCGMFLKSPLSSMSYLSRLFCAHVPNTSMCRFIGIRQAPNIFIWKVLVLNSVQEMNVPANVV